MDTRSAFLSTTRTLAHALAELASYRIVGNTAFNAILEVNVLERQAHAAVTVAAVERLRRITPAELYAFNVVFNESAAVVGQAWLDSYLSEVEEALYLHDPASLGESVQVKLGKVLACTGIDELVHDLARRRVREKAQWGLRGRLAELRDRYKFAFSVSDDDLDWMSDLRNNLVHNRRVGEFITGAKRVRYNKAKRQSVGADQEVQRFLKLVAHLLGDLYTGCAAALEISARNPGHRRNMRLIRALRRAWV